jgi:hypothetical protein
VELGKVPYVQPVIQGNDKLLIEKDAAPSVTKEVQVNR